MKIAVALALLTTNLLLAFNAKVKKNNITVTINEQEKTLKKGETIELKGGDIVCYKTGEGRLLIKGNGYKKQLNKKSSPCQHLPFSQKRRAVNPARLIAIPFNKAQESTVNAAIRATKIEKNTKATLALKSNQKYILLQNNTWSPMPIYLTILDTKDEEIKKLKYSDCCNDSNTSFLIPVSFVKDGYTLKVTNCFKETLAIVKIKK